MLVSDPSQPRLTTIVSAPSWLGATMIDTGIVRVVGVVVVGRGSFAVSLVKVTTPPHGADESGGDGDRYLNADGYHRWAPLPTRSRL
jgi:hypothetical protein